jgi:hypothetical protein
VFLGILEADPRLTAGRSGRTVIADLVDRLSSGWRLCDGGCRQLSAPNGAPGREHQDCWDNSTDTPFTRQRSSSILRRPAGWVAWFHTRAVRHPTAIDPFPDPAPDESRPLVPR